MGKERLEGSSGRMMVGFLFEDFVLIQSRFVPVICVMWLCLSRWLVYGPFWGDCLRFTSNLPHRLTSDIGHLLAIACGDNSIRVMSSYSGKVVHHYPARKQSGSLSGESTEQTPKITCLGWGVNFTDYKSAQHHLKDPTTTPFSLESFLSQESDPSKANILKADLPRELAMLDIESSLPKLSTLPGTGSE